MGVDVKPVNKSAKLETKAEPRSEPTVLGGRAEYWPPTPNSSPLSQVGFDFKASVAPASASKPEARDDAVTSTLARFAGMKFLSLPDRPELVKAIKAVPTLPVAGQKEAEKLIAAISTNAVWPVVQSACEAFGQISQPGSPGYVYLQQDLQSPHGYGHNFWTCGALVKEALLAVQARHNPGPKN